MVLTAKERKILWAIAFNAVAYKPDVGGVLQIFRPYLGDEDVYTVCDYLRVKGMLVWSRMRLRYELTDKGRELL